MVDALGYGRLLNLASIVGLPIVVAAPFVLLGSFQHSLLYYVIFPAIIDWALTMDFTVKPLSARWTGLGNISYGSYLLHMPILMMLKTWIDGRSDRFDILASPWMLCGFIAVVVAVSALSYRFFESPVQSFIRKMFDAKVAPRFKKSARTAF